MKKTLLSAALIITSVFAFAQNALKISAANEIVWYGLDFTKLKCIGNVGSKMDVIKNKHMASWNHLVAAEPQNFKLKNAVDKEIYYDISPVTQSNATIDAAKMETFNAVSTDLDKAAIEEVVKRYTGGDKASGVALVFIVVSLDKPAQTSTVYATFFDIASKNVLASKKFTSNIDGIGFRNYWAGAWKHIINDMDKKYDSWQ